MSRRPVIAGNWKMHHGPSRTREFLERFSPRFEGNGEPPELLLFPPSISLPAASDALPGDVSISLGVQNVHWESEGAFTGEISVAMAGEAGASHALVGHSERRHLFGETDEEVARKVRAVRKGGLVPVLCLGETLEQRRADRVAEVIVGQLEAAFPALSPEDGTSFLLAYEPVWAIGTGETATPEDASSAHGTLRAWLERNGGTEVARETPILYGGSVKPHNARELLTAPEVDGVLVGGASLDPESFARIAEAA